MWSRQTKKMKKRTNAIIKRVKNITEAYDPELQRIISQYALNVSEKILVKHAVDTSDRSVVVDLLTSDF